MGLRRVFGVRCMGAGVKAAATLVASKREEMEGGEQVLPGSTMDALYLGRIAGRADLHGVLYLVRER